LAFPAGDADTRYESRPGTPVLGRPSARASQAPVHDYNAVEVTADKRLGTGGRFTPRIGVAADGHVEGFYRDDNGQSDPGITSL